MKIEKQSLLNFVKITKRLLIVLLAIIGVHFLTIRFYSLINDSPILWGESAIQEEIYRRDALSYDNAIYPKGKLIKKKYGTVLYVKDRENSILNYRYYEPEDYGPVDYDFSQFSKKELNFKEVASFPNPTKEKKRAISNEYSEEEENYHSSEGSITEHLGEGQIRIYFCNFTSGEVSSNHLSALKEEFYKNPEDLLYDYPCIYLMLTIILIIIFFLVILLGKYILYGKTFQMII